MVGTDSIACTNPGYRSTIDPDERFFGLPEANRWNKLRLVHQALVVLWIRAAHPPRSRRFDGRLARFLCDALWSTAAQEDHLGGQHCQRRRAFSQRSTGAPFRRPVAHSVAASRATRRSKYFGSVGMIFVTVGSQLPFDRLISAVDDWAAGRPDSRTLRSGGRHEQSSGRTSLPFRRCPPRSISGGLPKRT